MWCPQCKSEYRVGITVCPECKTSLVEKLPEEERRNMRFIKYEELLTTSNAADIALIKSILDSAAITYYFKGEYFHLARPWADPARLMVKKEEVEEAKELLKDLKIKFWVFPLSEDEEKSH